MLRFPTSALVTGIALTIGIIFGVLGFTKAGDSRVSPALVSVFLFISGICFAIQFVNGIRTHVRWQRVLAVISALVAVFVVVMAIVFYQALSQVAMPKF